MQTIKKLEEIISDKGYDTAHNNKFLITREEVESISEIPKELYNNILV
jgi:hypothetical protein